MQIANTKWKLLGGPDILIEDINSDGYYVLDDRYNEFDAVAQCFAKAFGTGTFSVTIEPFLSAFIEDGVDSLISVDSVTTISGTGPIYTNLPNLYSFKGSLIIHVVGLTAGQSLNMRVYK
jgi:hypothetical protein